MNFYELRKSEQDKRNKVVCVISAIFGLLTKKITPRKKNTLQNLPSIL